MWFRDFQNQNSKSNSSMFHVYKFKFLDNWKCRSISDIHFLHDEFHDFLSNQIFFELLFVFRDKYNNELSKIILINNFQISTKRLQYFVIWKNNTNNWIFVRDCRIVFELIVKYYRDHCKNRYQELSLTKGSRQFVK